VRLVDRKQAHIGSLEQVERVRLVEPLGRDVDEAKLPARHLVDDLAVLGKIVRGVETPGGDAVAAKLRHLIAHQRDQRRDHHGKAVAQQRGKLITQRLPAARGHDRQHVAAAEQRLDDFALAGPKRLEPERSAEGLLGCGEVGHRRVP
jgi:hypothetical protein